MDRLWLGFALSFLFPSFARADEALRDEPIAPLPALAPRETLPAKLGKLLFRDKRLSRNDTVSCASCHDMAKGGADGLAFSIGVDGARGDINAPTVLNSGLNLAQFWDGRAATLAEQVDGPIAHPNEMATNWPDVLKKLRQDTELVQLSERAYGKPLSESVIREAIAAFEGTLLTVNSRFDRYLRGDRQALSATEKRGYENFKSFGCASCHQGTNVGGNMYQKLGVMEDYFVDQAKRRKLRPSDNGRFNVTKLEEDRHVFRVPSLRNVELTAPYFHDASAPTLPDAVRAMAKYQLGRRLLAREVEEIVSFLKTLTGEIPEHAK